MAKKKIITEVGKRKVAVARATIRAGKGIVRINSIPIEVWSTKYYRLRAMEPLLLAGSQANKVDIDVNVRSGGVSAQADAVRTAIARALVKYTGSEKLKNLFLEYDRNLLISDMRQNEPWKPGPSKPRAAAQKSKR